MSTRPDGTRRIPYGWLVLLLSLLIVAPMLAPGYWWGAHDARHALYFLFEFDRSISDGILWPRWSPDFAFGYGYPFFNIYGPLSTFVGEALHRLGLDLVSAVKGSFALTVPLSGLAMYGFVRRLAGRSAGFVAAVAYLFLPYHLAVLFVRAAMAEAWAFVFFPLVLWGFYDVVTTRRARSIVFAALAYGAFFLAHPGLALQATLVLIPWSLLWLLRPAPGAPPWRERAWWLPRLQGGLAAAGSALLGLVAAGIFVIPWLLESGYVNQEQWFAGYFNYSQHFIALWQLLSPFWGFGTSEVGVAQDSFPFQLGLVPLLLAVLAWVRVAPTRSTGWARGFLSAMLLATLFLTLEPSRWLWDSPFGQLVLKPMQFPWRFLIVAGVALSALAGLSAHRLRPAPALLLAALLVVGSWPYLQVERIEPAEGPVGLAGLMRFQQSAAEMTGQSACVPLEHIPTWSPLAEAWVHGQEVVSKFDYADLAEGALARNPHLRTAQEMIEVELPQAQRVSWHITHFPGWKVYRVALDEERILEALPIEPEQNSCHISVMAPAGHYRLLVRFEDTPVRVLGTWASGAGLLVMGALLLAEGRVNRRRDRPAAEGAPRARD